MTTNRLRTPATGDIRIGDVVRIGKGRANWTVTGLPCAASDAISIVSDKGAARALDTAETLTIMIRDGVEMLSAWLTAEMSWLEKRAKRACDMCGESTMDADATHCWRCGADAEIAAPVAETETEYLDYDDTERCVVCGEFVDYCQGHGEIGDPHGYAIMVAHDNGDHSACDERGCDIAAQRESATASGHVDYPHVPGYLYGCDACESGPCVCSEPCNEGQCITDESHAPGAKFAHNAPCVSAECIHPETLNERAAAGETVTSIGDLVHAEIFGRSFIGRVTEIHSATKITVEDINSKAVRVVVSSWTPYDPDQTYADAEDYVRMMRPELLRETGSTPEPVSGASDAHSAPEPRTAPEPVTGSGWKVVPAPRRNRAQRRADERRQRREHKRTGNPFGWNF